MLARYKKYSDIISLKNPLEARASASQMLEEFNRAEQRSKKVRVKRAVVQAANRAGVASENMNLTERERKEAAEIQRIYNDAKDKMAIAPNNPHNPASPRKYRKLTKPLSPKEMMIVTQEEYVNMTPKEKQDYGNYINKIIKGWVGAYVPAPGDINKLLASREWNVITPQGVMIKTVPEQKRRKLIASQQINNNAKDRYIILREDKGILRAYDIVPRTLPKAEKELKIIKEVADQPQDYKIKKISDLKIEEVSNLSKDDVEALWRQR